MTSEVMAAGHAAGHALVMSSSNPTSSATSPSPFGRLLREWRTRRGTSQLGLATETGVSSRHLSYLETGRSQPSREMVLRLSEALDVPLRERNELLACAGFAALYHETELASPAMGPVNRALDFLLEQHAPFPAILMDRCWNILKMNAACGPVLGAFSTGRGPYVEQPLNLLRITLHPDGLQPLLVNFEEVAYEMIAGAHRAAARSGGAPELVALYEELAGLPGVHNRVPIPDPTRPPVLILPLHIKNDETELRLFSVITVIGSAQDVTVEELRIESMMPADDATEEWIRAQSAGTEKP